MLGRVSRGRTGERTSIEVEFHVTNWLARYHLHHANDLAQRARAERAFIVQRSNRIIVLVFGFVLGIRGTHTSIPFIIFITLRESAGVWRSMCSDYMRISHVVLQQCLAPSKMKNPKGAFVMHARLNATSHCIETEQQISKNCGDGPKDEQTL